MTKLPQVSHERVVHALQRKGLWRVIQAGTLRQILDAAHLTPEEFKNVL